MVISRSEYRSTDKPENSHGNQYTYDSVNYHSKRVNHGIPELLMRLVMTLIRASINLFVLAG